MAQRVRARRVVAPVVVASAVAGAVALLEVEDAPSWLGWCPPWLATVLVAVAGVAGAGWLDQWLKHRQDEADLERTAVARLQAHLGRAERLPQLGERGADALMLRVHKTTPAPAAAAGQPPVLAVRRGVRRRRPPAGRSGRDATLPVFVEREIGEQVRDWMRTASIEGGFLVLVGNSSVGKTRLLYESARSVLGDFVVLAPELGDGGLVNTVAATTFPLPKLIVWLDELQRFLPGPYFTANDTDAPITAATVRKLLTAPTPVIIVGTLWPQYAATLRAQDTETATSQPRYRYPGAADILTTLDQVADITVPTFSGAERTAAEVLAATDPRLAQAVADPHYNVTQALAGAPEIMRRYHQASPEQQAIIHAAADARRLGIQAPLTQEFLQDAARGYFTTTHPDDTWFTPALTELTSAARPHDRATSPLIPISAPGHHTDRGYTVTDYLLQHLTRTRRSATFTAHTLHALTHHTTDPDDRLRLAESAQARMLNRTAEVLYRSLAATYANASFHLIELLVERGDVEAAIEILRAQADAGNEVAAIQLADLLVEQGDVEAAIEILRAQADAGDSFAAIRLAGLLVERGHVEVLRARADAGDSFAAIRLVDLLYDNADGVQLNVEVHAGTEKAAAMLLRLLRDHGQAEEAAHLQAQGMEPSESP